MVSESENRSSTMLGPWKLFRIILRIILSGILACIVLALLWAFLPSPSTERDSDNGADYATSVLRAGNVLTRVYE
jgi:hypothetical protein